MGIMRRRRQEVEEFTRAADQFTEAARELSSSLHRFLEYQQERDLREYRQRGEEASHEGLPEEVAASIAVEAVRETRKAMASGREKEQRFPPPRPEEVEEWERRREDRRKREDR